MRTFISINIPEKIRKQILQIQNSLPEFVGKKTEPENLHLTLKFLGEDDENKVEEIRKKLGEIKFNKFETEIDSLGVFDENFIKIIWLHLKNCEQLQKQVDAKLSKIGFKKEKRFMDHLTIARVKKIENRKEFLEDLKKIKIPTIKFIVNKFYLKESLLSSEGLEYKVLNKYTLL